MPKITNNATLALLRGHRDERLERLATQHARNAAARARTQQPAEAPAGRVALPANLLGAFVDRMKQVPSGHYALRRPDGTVDFLRVYRENEGRHNQRDWIVRLQGAPGSFAEIKMPYRLMYLAAGHLTKDLRAASILFGQETRTCGVCNSPLTNEKSRAAGIGPVCAKRF